LWHALVWIYGISVGALFGFYFRLVHASSRITVSGEEGLDEKRGYFFTCWHDRFPIYLATLPRHEGQVWMIHPSDRMQPMRQLALWSGVKEIVSGATGQQGREAAGRLVRALSEGGSTSTVFLPDGPNSDPRKLRNGILHMAHQSGLAIVPMHLEASRALRLPTWDKKAVPLPFTRIELRYCAPLPARAPSDRRRAALTAALDGDAVETALK